MRFLYISWSQWLSKRRRLSDMIENSFPGWPSEGQHPKCTARHWFSSVSPSPSKITKDLLGDVISHLMWATTPDTKLFFFFSTVYCIWTKSPVVTPNWTIQKEWRLKKKSVLSTVYSLFVEEMWQIKKPTVCFFTWVCWHVILSVFTVLVYCVTWACTVF